MFNVRNEISFMVAFEKHYSFILRSFTNYQCLFNANSTLTKYGFKEMNKFLVTTQNEPYSYDIIFIYSFVIECSKFPIEHLFFN